MSRIALVATLLLVGRAHAMTNDEIIREVKKCRDAGLEARDLTGWSGETEKVECVVPRAH